MNETVITGGASGSVGRSSSWIELGGKLRESRATEPRDLAARGPVAADRHAVGVEAMEQPHGLEEVEPERLLEERLD